MRFTSLGSGSTGNATLVEASSGATTTRVLIDCGFTLKVLESRLGRVGLGPSDLDAIFVTHEHGDHVGCAATVARRHGVPLWMSRGTWLAIGQPDLPAHINFARDGMAVPVGDLQLQPYTVPHDAHEPLQLTLSDGVSRLGVLTDAGSSTPYLVHRLQGCAALLIECNHDRDLLAVSSYPASLKARVGGRWGHLANDTSAEILAACAHSGLRHVVAAHLSQQNNRPDLAATALAHAVGTAVSDIVIASPDKGFDWLDVR